MTRRRTLMVLVAALLVGCKLGPNYKRPEVDAPATFRSASTQPTTAPTTQPTVGDLEWWDAFNDPTLKQLIEDGAEKQLRSSYRRHAH